MKALEAKQIANYFNENISSLPKDELYENIKRRASQGYYDIEMPWGKVYLREGSLKNNGYKITYYNAFGGIVDCGDIGCVKCVINWFTS